jgi:hypothetical protein
MGRPGPPYSPTRTYPKTTYRCDLYWRLWRFCHNTKNTQPATYAVRGLSSEDLIISEVYRSCLRCCTPLFVRRNPIIVQIIRSFIETWYKRRFTYSCLTMSVRVRPPLPEIRGGRGRHVRVRARVRAYASPGPADPSAARAAHFGVDRWRRAALDGVLLLVSPGGSDRGLVAPAEAGCHVPRAFDQHPRCRRESCHNTRACIVPEPSLGTAIQVPSAPEPCPRLAVPQRDDLRARGSSAPVLG